MKAIYQKNHKKILQFFNEESTSFVPKNEPLKSLNGTNELIEKRTITLSYWAGDYSNPIKNIFLYQVSNLKQISSFPFLFCRDGVFCVIDFFHRHPSPSNIKTILILNYNVAKLVPTSWQKNVVFYELGEYSVFNYQQVENDEKSIIIKGSLLTSTGENLDESEKILKKLNAINLKKFKKIKLFLWSRDDYFLNKQWSQDLDYSRRMNQFYPKLISMLSDFPDVEFVDYMGLNNLKSYHRYCYLDILPKINYISDDLTDFLLLSRGVRPYEGKEQVEINPRDFIPLSAYHGYRLVPSSELDAQEVGCEQSNLSKIKNKLNINSSDDLSADFFVYLHQSEKFVLQKSLKVFKS